MNIFPLKQSLHSGGSLEVQLFEEQFDGASKVWTLSCTSENYTQPLKVFLQDPSSPELEKEFLWYWEDFALQDPFEKSRALAVERNLLQYAKAIWNALEDPLADHLRRCQPGMKVVGLHLAINSSGSKSSLQRLHWELLETPQLWTGLLSNCQSIRISRRVRPLASLETHECPTVKSTFNVLVMTARPYIDEDIPYRLVSKDIWKILRKSPNLRQSVKVKFVRPGTWEALAKELKDKHKGYYHLIHFDTHGGVDQATGEAYLLFASSSPSSQDPVTVSATTVAQLIKDHGIQLAFLNACNSADTRQTPTSNLAYTFASHGISHTVAMCAKVNGDAALNFVRVLYQELFLNGKEIRTAVALARGALRSSSSRAARCSLAVECDDSCIPVLYQSSDYTFRWHPIALKEFDPPENADITTGDSAEYQPATGTELLIESSISRSLDILCLERQLAHAHCVLVTGIGGIGKTSLARYLSQWWVESEYVKGALYLDSLEMVAQENLLVFSKILERLDPSLYESFLTKHNALAQDNQSPGLFEEQAQKTITEGQYAIVVDNLDDLANQSSGEAIKLFNRLLQAFETSTPRAYLLIFLRPAIYQFKSTASPLPSYNMETPSTLEGCQIALHYLRGANPSYIPSREDAEALDIFVEYHKCNPLLLKIFMSTLPAGSHLERVAKETQTNMLAWLADAIQLSLDAEDSGMLRSFRYALRKASNHRLEVSLLLSLAPFQKAFPWQYKHVAAWFFKLHEHDILSCGNVKKFRLRSLKESKIRVFDDDKWEESAEFFKDWMPSFERASLDCLMRTGLATISDSSSSDGWPYLELHPLLPYLLRSEILRAERERGNSELSKLSTAFWEYYEIRSSTSIGSSGENVLNSIALIFKYEQENLFNALALGITKPDYCLYESTIVWLFQANMQALRGKARYLSRTGKLIQRVIIYFEEWSQNQSWVEQQTMEKVHTMAESGLMWFCNRSVILVLLGQGDAIRSNTTRGLQFHQRLQKTHGISSNALVWDHGLRCRVAYDTEMENGFNGEFAGRLQNEIEPAGLDEARRLIFQANKILVAMTISQARFFDRSRRIELPASFGVDFAGGALGTLMEEAMVNDGM